MIFNYRYNKKQIGYSKVEVFTIKETLRRVIDFNSRPDKNVKLLINVLLSLFPLSLSRTLVLLDPERKNVSHISYVQTSDLGRPSACPVSPNKRRV